MTKEEILQKVNEYCNEKSYTDATLTDAFKEKFAEHFANRYPDAQAADDAILGDMRFAINTAFSGASQIITIKAKEFDLERNKYKSQIEELNNQIANQNQQEPPTLELPNEIKNRLERLERFENEEAKKAKLNEIVGLAKKGIRENLHGSFDSFARDYNAVLDAPSDEQAKKLTDRFQDIFKDSIGDIKPLAPQQVRKREDDIINNIKPVKL